MLYRPRVGEDSFVFRGPGLFAFPLRWSCDGRWLVARVSDPTGAFDLWILLMAGQGAPHPYQHSSAAETGAAISPDGRWLAYTATEDGKAAAYVQSFPEPGAKSQIAVEGPAGCLWSDRGDQLLVVNQKGEVFSVPVTTTSGFLRSARSRLFASNRHRTSSTSPRASSAF